jgi:hypothetical membrane protein
MILKIRGYSLSSITGLLAVSIFTIFTFISVALYPATYNPLYDWLSNLGNINFNPIGAYFFNWGCILAGLTLIPFFAGLYSWNPRETYSKILLILGILLGIFASISLILVGIFPETHITQHMLAAAGVFGSLFIIIILVNLALFKNPKFIRSVAYYGFFAIIIDLSFKYMMSANKDILGIFNPTTPIPGFEWASVFASLAWVGFLALNMAIKKV